MEAKNGDGTLRHNVDCRRSNGDIKRVSFRLSRIHQTLYSLGDPYRFTTSDLFCRVGILNCTHTIDVKQPLLYLRACTIRR